MAGKRERKRIIAPCGIYTFFCEHLCPCKDYEDQGSPWISLSERSLDPDQ